LQICAHLEAFSEAESRLMGAERDNNYKGCELQRRGMSRLAREIRGLREKLPRLSGNVFQFLGSIEEISPARIRAFLRRSKTKLPPEFESYLRQKRPG